MSRDAENQFFSLLWVQSDYFSYGPPSNNKNNNYSYK